MGCANLRRTLSLLTLAALTSCRTAATQIELILDSDAPIDRRIELRVLAVRGEVLPHQLEQLAAERMLTDITLIRDPIVAMPRGQQLDLPGSLTVLPAPEATAEPVSVWLRGRIAASATAPEIILDRVVRLSFIRGVHGYARIFLPIRCGDRATNCTSVVAEQCTVSLRCREQGATCGDLGECVAPAVAVSNAPEGGVLADTPAAAVDAIASRLDVSSMDVPSVDASDASDVRDVSVADRTDATTSDIQDAQDAQDVMDSSTDSGVDPLVVINTMRSGVGSLSAAIDSANARCMSNPAPAITFNIPRTDPGFLTRNGRSWWRIAGSASTTLTCAGTIVDGITQTLRQGNTNTAVFGQRAVGMAAAALPTIEGPEIELRAVDLSANAASVQIRGVGVRTIAVNNAANVQIDQCLFDTEMDSLAPLPMAERPTNNSLIAAQFSPNLQITRNVFVWQIGMTNTSNGLHIISNSSDPLIRDNYMTGSGGGAGPGWDEIHLNPALRATVSHNYLGGTNWQFHIEWVGGVGGTVSENTFRIGPQMVSMGGAATMSGNVTE
jgi:hypothetical protein